MSYESFGSLIESLKKTREKCPWASKQEIEKHVHELMDEAKEAVDAVRNSDYGNLKEELGDILMDLLFIAIVAEEKGYFTVSGMVKDVNEKLVRRKPWVFGSEVIRTREEAISRWNEIKLMERRNK